MPSLWSCPTAMTATCPNCLAGRHSRCSGRSGCPCSVCGARRRTVIPRAETAIQRPKAPKQPPKPKRSYPLEIVERAAVLKEAGRSWQGIADELEVPREGIRYAVTAYGVECKAEDVTRTRAERTLVELHATIASAEALIEEARQLIHALPGIE
jgi:hypothetical protein